MAGKRNGIGIGAAVGGTLGLALGAWLGDLFGGVLGGAFLGGLFGLVVQSGGRTARIGQPTATHDGLAHHHMGAHALGLGAMGAMGAHQTQSDETRPSDATCAPDMGSAPVSTGADFCGPADSGGGGD